MLSFNNIRLNILLDLDTEFDYREFVSKCIEVNVPTMTPHDFAQKAGMVYCAKVMYPELPPAEAYTRFATEQRPMFEKPKPCGDCGGGKVR